MRFAASGGAPRPAPRRIGWPRGAAALARFAAGYRQNRAAMSGLVVLIAYVTLAVAAPVLIPAGDLSAIHAPGDPLQPPSTRFPLGTDSFGRPMTAVTLWGARISLTVGFLAALMAIGIGTVTGILAGHFRGWTDFLLLRVTDWFLVLPPVLLATVLAAVLRPGTATVIVAIGVTSWPATARLVRAQVLTTEERPYVERARWLGGGHGHVLARHVLPEVVPVVLVQTALTASGAILAEAALAFLGLSDPTKISWGTTLQLATGSGAVSAGDWWVLLPPGVAITVITLAVALCGRGIDAAVDASKHPASPGCRA